ncbi:MAG: hypothetical protein ABI967_04405 [bacterium]
MTSNTRLTGLLGFISVKRVPFDGLLAQFQQHPQSAGIECCDERQVQCDLAYLWQGSQSTAQDLRFSAYNSTFQAKDSQCSEAFGVDFQHKNSFGQLPVGPHSCLSLIRGQIRNPERQVCPFYK